MIHREERGRLAQKGTLPMPELLIKFKDRIIERVVTEKQHLTIGRTADNDIVLDNRGISRRHAQIEFSDNGALLIDNDSLNGTFVNKHRVTEQSLADRDTITIGKYDLVFFKESEQPYQLSDIEGTMLLNTRKQRDMVNRDLEEKKLTAAAGGSIFLEVFGSEKKVHLLGPETTTLGKSNLVDIRVGGFWLPKVQAKVAREGQSFTITNVGRRRKTRVNGEVIDSQSLKNGDIIEVGGSTFRFIEGKQ